MVDPTNQNIYYMQSAIACTSICVGSVLCLAIYTEGEEQEDGSCCMESFNSNFDISRPSRRNKSSRELSFSNRQVYV